MRWKKHSGCRDATLRGAGPAQGLWPRTGRENCPASPPRNPLVPLRKGSLHLRRNGARSSKKSFSKRQPRASGVGEHD